MNMDILLIGGAFFVGLPFIVIGLVAYWREKQHEKEAQSTS